MARHTHHGTARNAPAQAAPTLERIRKLIPQLMRWNANANDERRCSIVVVAVSLHGGVVDRNSKAVADACAIVATCAAVVAACAAVGLLVTAAAVARATGWHGERVGEEGRGWFVGQEAALGGAHQLRRNWFRTKHGGTDGDVTHERQVFFFAPSVRKLIEGVEDAH